MLDWQVYFAKNDDGTDKKEASPFVWENSNKPATYRSTYPALKRIFESSENVEKSTKSDTPNNFQQGHRKPMFTEEQKQQIIYEYTHYNTPKTQLAQKYHCSEKTIRNILKYVLKGE